MVFPVSVSLLGLVPTDFFSEREQTIIDGMRDVVFAQQRQGFHALGPIDECDDIGIIRKSRTVLCDIVGDNEIEILLRSFRAAFSSTSSVSVANPTSKR